MNQCKSPNSSVLLDLVADPGGMLGGQYFANVSIENNDPLDETRNISVAMNLTGCQIFLMMSCTLNLIL